MGVFLTQQRRHIGNNFLKLLLPEGPDQQSNMDQVIPVQMLRRKRLQDVLNRKVEFARIGGELLRGDVEAMVVSWSVCGDIFQQLGDVLEPDSMYRSISGMLLF